MLATPANNSHGTTGATAPITLSNSVVTTNSQIFVGLAAAPVTFAGPWTLGTNTSLQYQPAGTTLTISGPMSGAFAFTKAGVGILALTGSNSFSGGTTVSAGT